MIEIRIHGRGGQGSVTMAELIAEAAFIGGKIAQAFPNFGVERRGAPVTAYVRIDDKPIRLRSQISTPDLAIVQDPTLLDGGKLLAGLKNGGLALVNSSSAVACQLPKNGKIKFVPATDIAVEAIGRPIINTVMLGAFAASSGLITLEAVNKAIRHRFSGEMAEKNVIAARQGYEAVANN